MNELKERINNILNQDNTEVVKQMCAKYLTDIDNEHKRERDKLIEHYNETIYQIFECWRNKLPLKDMSAYDIVESIENVVQQRLPGFDAYASTPKWPAVTSGNRKRCTTFLVKD